MAGPSRQKNETTVEAYGAFSSIWPGTKCLSRKRRINHISGRRFNDLKGENVFRELSNSIRNNELLCFITSAIILRLYPLLTTDNFIQGDATSRLQKAIQFYHWPTILPHQDWLPLHFWIMGFSSLITDEFIWGPRIMSFIFAIATLPFLYKLNALLFGRDAARFASLLYIISPPIAYMCGITLSEPFYIFFAVSSLFCFFHYMNTSDRRYLLFMALFMGANLLIRYEGWIIATLLVIGAWSASSKSNKNLTLIPLTAMLLILSVFFYQQYLHFGDPLIGLTYSDYEVRRYYELNPTNLYDKLDNIKYAFPFYSFLGVFSIFWINNRKSRSRQVIYYQLFSFIIFLSPLYKLLNGTLILDFRYFFLPAILFLPLHYKFLSNIGIKILAPFNLKWKFHILMTALALSIILLFTKSYTHINRDYPMRFDRGLKETARFVKNHVSPDKKIFLDKEPSRNNKNAWSQNGWYAYANRIPGRQVNCRAKDRYWVGDTFNETYLKQCIFDRKSEIFVLFKNGIVHDFLNERPDYFLSLGFSSERLFEFQEYSVLQITKL